MLKKRDVIISSIKIIVRKITHKYGIRIPMSVDHAYEINKKNADTLWLDAIFKEMHNAGVGF